MAIPRNLANIAPAMNGSGGKVTIGGSTPLGTFNLVGLTRPSGVVTYTTAEASAKAQAGLNWYEDNNANFEYYLDIFATSTNESPWAGSNIRMLTTPVGTTTAVERARITRDGNLLVGTTSVIQGSKVGIKGSTVQSGLGIDVDSSSAGAYSGVIVNRTASDGDVSSFLRAGTLVGKISVTTTATSYVTSSDYRLKNSVTPMTGALDKVSQLKPVTYKWNADGSDGQGFIAHELAAVCPDAVTGEKDATRIEQYEVSPFVSATYDEEGNELTPAVQAVMGEREVPVYQGIDTSFLVATLTAAIQELKAEFDAYKASHS